MTEAITLQDRENRLAAAFRLESNEALFAPYSEHFFSALQAGMSHADAMRDHAAKNAAMKAAAINFGYDIAPGSGIYPAQAYEAIGAENYRWPGGDFPDDQPFQYVEDEYLRAEEYDAFLADPTGFSLQTAWPRMAKAFRGLAGADPIFALGPDPIYLGGLFGTPEGNAFLDAMKELGVAINDWFGSLIAYGAEMNEAGYPVAYGPNFTPAFDAVGDFLRGMKGQMLDMFRMPDKLMAAVELYVKPQIESTIHWADAVENRRVVLWMHKGAKGFMSDEQFATLYWPGMKRIILALLEADCIPILNVQGDYTPRLKYLAELPAGRVPIHYQDIDLDALKKELPDKQCIWGGVPASMMIASSPQEVSDHVKKLIDMFAAYGGLLVDGSQGIPDEAKPENIEAISETVRTYGR